MNVLHSKLPDTNQSAWQLASIQLAGITSLPVFATSIILLNKYQFTSTIASLICGNIILAVIRYFMIVMSDKTRKSTMDLAKEYLGRHSAFGVAILLLAATLAWYVTETTLASNSLFSLLAPNVGENLSAYIRICVFIGVISTLCCMEGIVALRWLSVISLPILFLLAISIAWVSSANGVSWSFDNFTLAGIPLVVATNLGATADIPTFFRHSASRKESLKALIIIQIASFILAVIGVFLATVIQPWQGIYSLNPLIDEGLIFRWGLLALVFISTINANVSNIYSASVGWEIVAPILARRKEWLILGLGLTIASVLLINLFSLDILLNVADNSLVNLSLIFIVGFLITKYFKGLSRLSYATGCMIAWLVASLLTILTSFNWIFPAIPPVFIGLFSMVFVMTIYFFIKILSNKTSY